MQKLIKEKNLECSEVFCYNEEFIGNKNQKYARLSLIDANTFKSNIASSNIQNKYILQEHYKKIA